MKNKKTITATLVSDIQFEGSLSEVIASLEDLAQKYPDFTNLRIETEELMQGDDVYYTLKGDRLETDKEYQKRKKYENYIERDNNQEIERARALLKSKGFRII